MTSWNARFTIVLLVLAGTALFMNTRVAKCLAPKQISVASFPLQLGYWNGSEVVLDTAARRMLRGAILLQRVYHDTNTTEPGVDLYVAYYPNQHAGDRRHLPEECLAGSGWSAVESATVPLSAPGQQPFPVNRLVVERAGDRELVLYWFWARGRGAASEQWANAYLIFDSLRLNRSDDALIRINTPIASQEETSVAEQRLLSFATQAVPAMADYFPR
ncbi:MAG: EpsI family protein [Acidobacteriaceae bacterium]|nr:EpsI family protein [Acidobacteriaceae bacterium]